MVLLSALVAFLQPLIQGQATTKTNDQNYFSVSEAINGSEGKNLLSALRTFVKAVANLSPEIHDKQEDPPKRSMAVDENRMKVIPRNLSKDVAQSELEIMTLNAARAHVVNKMPIRLLAFDKDGSNIRLIQRDEIFSCILPGVLANMGKPKFQEEWAAAKMLKDDVRHRQSEMNELLQDVVEQSVDYAILSHTWMRDTPGEVTFHDWAMRERNPRGNTKIIRFCEATAQDHNITLGWIDTVCINKSSSSELDESIRSMYNWYRRASVCITHLSETANISDAHGDSWFTRGWTLQELLAPSRSVFYNKNWKQIGSGTDAEIQSVIKTATGITSGELELSWRGAIEAIPLSRRMQMACGRQVTREEDTSYSLMGLLGVDMSIAYGEGASRAFSRLVRELFNTKKNVMDLFNRRYSGGESLLPSSLEHYRYRTKFWDHPRANGGTYLNIYLPPNPIIPTHLGLHTPLLLAPCLIADIAENDNYAAKGALSAQLPIAFYTSTGEIDGRFQTKTLHYLMCHSRLYTADLADLHAPNHATMPDGLPRHISMIGIINFGIDASNHILLPRYPLALKLDWDGVEKGNFIPSGNVVIMPGPPFTMKLHSKKGFKIPKAELEEHGMQLISLYL
ncbi:hypothetical protein HYPSUDRAFT_37447 [Hypholoma sublateritium FD-334 SS-4]|uniref:Heterokaryon incompatibility domain-containing protein n=1 Tax=Hypholoma sublateritium (strain FD-334 SS-4) TaxID=945553 RepID=A0A0D2P3H9_HYPSF|nr:hypothetical protein HYPSUDRAFT_37447 [Hypholoma sublateritium FD-334 SS-4]